MSATWQLPTINIGDAGADAEIVDLDDPQPTGDGEECPCGDEDHTPIKCHACGLVCPDDCHVGVTAHVIRYHSIVSVTVNNPRTGQCIEYDDYANDEDTEDVEEELFCSCGRRLRYHCLEAV